MVNKYKVSGWVNATGAVQSHWCVGGKYVLVSTIDNSLGRETMVFAADMAGDVTDWIELYCTEYNLDHASVIDQMVEANGGEVPDAGKHWHDGEPLIYDDEPCKCDDCQYLDSFDTGVEEPEPPFKWRVLLVLRDPHTLVPHHRNTIGVFDDYGEACDAMLKDLRFVYRHLAKVIPVDVSQSDMNAFNVVLRDEYLRSERYEINKEYV
jgi:hypothetical protein